MGGCGMRYAQARFLEGFANGAKTERAGAPQRGACTHAFQKLLRVILAKLACRGNSAIGRIGAATRKDEFAWHESEA
ncbi:hypothetical protein C048_02294 [Brucella melitensis UK19/04]|nr:hypothetical protein C048_02294 [Brucella melitensis UK19/04]ENS55577.1 hypothetical protein C036_02737 [Brucella melitensis F1/06 B10]ENS67661.1 hypothetical protein C034_03144 [Brucella melitensis UK14/06]ENS70699.1 hypothetical protein C060_02762 [Brucella melitensis UK22/04]ENS73076.1 hypothetical protein C059_02283 [Brucella melitensis UK23/06]ENS77818.1 hypothetical protein C047_02290 [Brucella melitensis Uk24/06]ENT60314.1 hypothetical protein B968_02552 [Brucella suis F8/06-3]GFP6